MIIRKPLLTLSLLVLALTTALTGCGSEKKKVVSQVAVKVNDSEISVHQVNAILSRIPNVAPELKTQLQQRALERLVDLQLAYTQAVTQKLDRNPDVLTAIESAKQEIIARAYLNRITAAQPKPTDSEVGKFFSEHPELFEQRKLYSMESLLLEAKPETAQEIRTQLAAGANFAQIANVLQSKGVQFRPQQGLLPAEQAPQEILPQLVRLQDGETTLLETPRVLFFVHLVGSRPMPMNLQNSTPAIQRLLQTQKNQQALEAEIKRLKDSAKIEYVGEFAQYAPGKTTSTATAPAILEPATNDENSIDQGVAGLK
ncbi:MAG: EpsD family peptidyl-prolyl cis-trans isomerase [Zoogloeaceae bacterium]|nr:EpsD family peptidyl-prolyl cis-trans isomerase [Zoogloeaceae bacterium]